MKAIAGVPAAVLILVISGCADPPATVDAPRTEGGAWTEDSSEALAAGVSAYERSVLSDGKVTLADLEDAHDQVRGCLADSGLGIVYGVDGGFSLTALDGKYPDGFFERSDPILRACEKRYDEYVTMLFEQTRRNPEKQDEATITVACLRKAGLVPRAYTERKWRAENDTGVWSFKEFDPAAVQCQLDPLGLWRKG